MLPYTQVSPLIEGMPLITKCKGARFNNCFQVFGKVCHRFVIFLAGEGMDYDRKLPKGEVKIAVTVGAVNVSAK